MKRPWLYEGVTTEIPGSDTDHSDTERGRKCNFGSPPGVRSLGFEVLTSVFCLLTPELTRLPERVNGIYTGKVLPILQIFGQQFRTA